MKARIASHRNENDRKNLMIKECTVCSSIGLEIVQLVTSLFGWIIYKADVSSAFLQPGEMNRDVRLQPHVQ